MKADTAQPRVLYTACPLCESANFEPYAHADCSRHPLYIPEIPAKIQWMRCECSHVFTDGYFSESVTAKLLERSNPKQIPGSDMEAGRMVAGRIVERIYHYRGWKPGQWLDVGFGDGSLLMAAQEFGYGPSGIDIRGAAVEALATFGIHAGQGDFLEWASALQSGLYSVLSMADVLEHMPFPKDALRAAHRLLEPNGVLFVSCPNMDTALWRDLTRKNANPYWVEVEHHHCFGRQRLADLLAECGFTAVSYNISERYRIGMEIIARRV